MVNKQDTTLLMENSRPHDRKRQKQDNDQQKKTNKTLEPIENERIFDDQYKKEGNTISKRKRQNTIKS